MGNERGWGVKSKKLPKMCEILAKNCQKCSKFAEKAQTGQKCAFLAIFTLFANFLHIFQEKCAFFSHFLLKNHEILGERGGETAGGQNCERGGG